MDINPVNPGHALSVAKGHWPTVDVIPPDVLGAVAKTAQRVAKAVMSELKPIGVNLLQANGAGAGQSVPHLHIHIMPRRPNDGVDAQLGLQARRQGRDRGDLQAAEGSSVGRRCALAPSARQAEALLRGDGERLRVSD